MRARDTTVLGCWRHALTLLCVAMFVIPALGTRRSVCLSTHVHSRVVFPVCLCVCAVEHVAVECVCVCVLSNIVTLVYAASVCLQLSHCDRERVREVEYRESDNTKE